MSTPACWEKRGEGETWKRGEGETWKRGVERQKDRRGEGERLEKRVERPRQRGKGKEKPREEDLFFAGIKVGEPYVEKYVRS